MGVVVVVTIVVWVTVVSISVLSHFSTVLPDLPWSTLRQFAGGPAAVVVTDSPRTVWSSATGGPEGTSSDTTLASPRRVAPSPRTRGPARDGRALSTAALEVELRLTSPFCEMVAYMKQETERKVGALPGVTDVSVRHDSGLDWDHVMIAPAAQARRRRRLDALKRLPPRGTARAR